MEPSADRAAVLRLVEGQQAHARAPAGGTPKTKPAKPPEASMRLLDRMEAPDHFDPLAVEAWQRTVPELARANKLASVDAGALEAYCMAYSIMRRAYAALGSGDLFFEIEGRNGAQRKRHPAVQVWKDAAHEVKAFADALGVTPLARHRQGGNSPGLFDALSEDEQEQWTARPA